MCKIDIFQQFFYVCKAKICIQGTDQEPERASDEFGGHAFAIRLLGGYLARAHNGEIRKRDLIAKLTMEPGHRGEN